MMEECGMMLEKRHGFSAAQMLDYRNALMDRFRNPYIVDTVTRVAREPIRKLSPDDRIIAPLNYAHQYGIETPHYYTGIASLLLYCNPNDEQSIMIMNQIENIGVEKTLFNLSSIPIGSEISKAVISEFYRLSAVFLNKGY